MRSGHSIVLWFSGFIFKKMYYWFCRGRRRGFEEAGHLFGSLFQYAAWPMNFDPCSLLSHPHPHPARIHHTSGLLWQRSPLTFLRHLHLLLIKWTGSDPEYQWWPTVEMTFHKMSTFQITWYNYCYRNHYHFAFMHMADSFIRSDLHVIPGMEPMARAPLTRCSTNWTTGSLINAMQELPRSFLFTFRVANGWSRKRPAWWDTAVYCGRKVPINNLQPCSGGVCA